MTVPQQDPDQSSPEDNFESLLSQMDEKDNESEEGQQGEKEQPDSDDIQNKQLDKADASTDTEKDKPVEPPKNVPTFVKGDQKWEVDYDAEFTFRADNGEVTKTLKELRDAAAGDVAIRNRMREVAEEKKGLQKPIKKFISLSKTDPLRALKIISEQAKQLDEEFTYEGFIQALAKQGQKLSSMSPDERKAYEASRELEELKKENELQSEEVKSRDRRKEFLEKTRLSASDYEYMSEQILANETLSEKIETQADLDRMVGFLNEEKNFQLKAFALWKEVEPEIADTDIKNPLVLEVTKQMRQNPDFTDDDFKDIIKTVLVGRKSKKAIQSLSRKKISNNRSGYTKPSRQSKDNFQTLMDKIENKRKSLKN